MQRNSLLALALALALAGLGIAATSAQAAEIEVMTQNQYVGTDLIALVTEPNFNDAVVDALMTRAASLPTERMRALAKLIVKRNPALVGLQEVYAFGCYDGNTDDFKGCENPAVAGAFTDQLEQTLAALGGRYVEAATVVNLNLPAGLPPPLNGAPGIPIEYDDTTIYVSVVDRDVILARKGVSYGVTGFQSLAPAICSRPSADGCNYQAAASATFQLELNPPLVPAPMTVPVEVRFERGFVGVDAVVNGKLYRFVNTHLETRLEGLGPEARGFQSAQAYELIGSMQYMNAVAYRDKVIAVGDFNSDPNDPVYPVEPPTPAFLGVPPYLQMTSAAAGFLDVWKIAPGMSRNPKMRPSGLTCCQDADLANATSNFYERIDLIFSSSKPMNVPDVRVLGDKMAEKTLPRPFGVWPSDHGSVAARLIFKN